MSLVHAPRAVDLPGEEPGLSVPDDAALVLRAAEGDREAFDAIVTRHSPAVYRLARALTRDAASAEDVLQETFLAAWRHASGYGGRASVRTWLLTIARHAAQRFGEREARHDADEPELFELGLRAGWGIEDPETVAIRAQDRARLARALVALAPADREVLTLRDLEGLTGEDTAAVLGLDLAAMKSRLHRARLRLAAALSQGGRDGRA